MNHKNSLQTKMPTRVRFRDRRAKQASSGAEPVKSSKLRNWARDQGKTLRSSATVIAVSALARANPSTAVTHEAFDQDKFLLGTPGGTVDLRTGVLRPSVPEDMISRLATSTPAEPGVRPDRWLRFLADVMGDDSETVAFLQRAAGYALTGSTEEHKLLFLHGGIVRLN